MDKVTYGSWLRRRTAPSGSRVANLPVLGQEEAVEQGVDAEESLSREGDHVVAGRGQVAVGGQGGERLAESRPDVDLVLVLEIRRPDRPALQLEHQLADHPLLVAGPVGAAERQGAA